MWLALAPLCSVPRQPLAPVDCVTRERQSDAVGDAVTVSVLILTLNEEINVGECLSSLAWCDDVVVLDSLSTDRTRAIAEERGARAVTRPFDNWSAHQNWAVG